MSLMASTDTGRKAEVAAKVYLEMRGYKIIEQNWRRPRCEIDIIARKDDVMHFVEVKYHLNDDQDTGLDTITSTRLKQLQRAAGVWVDEYKWSGEYVLSTVEIAGTKFSVMGFIENVF